MGVIGDLARLLFGGALRVMHIAFYFVLRALIHFVSPFSDVDFSKTDNSRVWSKVLTAQLP
jgi:hypothetical protein